MCEWQDDPAQEERPWSSEGANGISLHEAQRNYARWGASRQGAIARVRPPRAEEPLDPRWRPYQLTETDRSRMERERIRLQRLEDLMNDRSGEGHGGQSFAG